MDDIDHYKNMDTHPFHGIKTVNFKGRLSQNPSLDNYFNGHPNYDQARNVTRGKVYTIHKVQAFGDVCDFFFMNDKDEEYSLSSAFFEKAV